MSQPRHLTRATVDNLLRRFDLSVLRYLEADKLADQLSAAHEIARLGELIHDSLDFVRLAHLATARARIRKA
jgi:hypothetical protein